MGRFQGTKKMMRSLLMLLFALALTSQACMAAETVVIGAEDDWPPYSSIKADKSGAEGLSLDLVREAFATRGIEVQFQVLPFARCMQYAASGRVSGCFNASRNESNAETYCWHPTPLFEDSLHIFGPATTPRSDFTIKDLEGKVVGLTIGYTYPDTFSKNKKIKHFRAVSDDHLIKMLVAGRVDFILLNRMPAYQRINADPSLKAKIKSVGVISHDKFWVAFSKYNEGPRHCELFEQGMQALVKSGRYEEITKAFRKRMGF